ncbi:MULTISPECIES: acyltransferase family protein [unclassified Marinobacterium]|uniref:acyltransferase family protein n=1 Tax=unclassified Marinobacterium TaxID=2644139 RepID=UPI00156959F2|nr:MULTISPECIES: acyltransferase family protein [unclassified Marinobacterium]NRP53644.1 O-acetyltransferase OatA [Marinobacterium sp. xm-v-242]NRP77894.1 O-acetyltransferase OatA [Marinobacterium sp. xm-m-383]
MNYRADIQILRGIAVSMVLLFHFGFSAFQSGFLGVDVFFVISGFLMAMLYKKGHKKDFYTRRAKRLLPAYFATIIATLVVAAIVTVPSDYSQVKEQSLFAIFYSSNIGFWLQNSYFSKAEFNPLLHLWSLGVEIQFYLFVPLVALIYRWSKSLFYLALLTSLGLCFLVVMISPKTSFFMMPLRAWEFLLGFAVAKLLVNNVAREQAKKIKPLQILSLLLLLGVPLIPVDGQSLSIIFGHPGSFALIITGVTALVLGIGLPEQLTKSFIGKTLEKIGNYSYSIYLVHFPVIVLANYEPFGGTILATDTLTSLLVQIALVAVLSIACYRIVEKMRIKNTNSLIGIGTAAVLVIGIAGTTIQENTFTEEQLKIFAAWEDRSPYRCGKVFRLLNPSERICSITENPTDALKPVLLVGNSHADSLKTEFANVAKKLGYETFFYVPNDPLMKDSSIRASAIINDAKALHAEKVILHFSPNGVSQQELISLLENAEREPNITVSFIAPVPVYGKHIPKALYGKSIGNKEELTQTIADYERKNSEEILLLRELLGPNFIEAAGTLCTPDCEITDEDGKPLYFDEGHLTLTGARKLSSVYEKALIM